MPTQRNCIIVRDNLIRLFNSLTENRIMNICAPAGYGKTVAVRQWMNSLNVEKAVISLDEYDNNSTHFCERFCGALLTCQPKNASLAEIVLHPAFGSAPDEFSLQAISALSAKKSAILVMDDLHFVHNQKVLKLIRTFLKQLPQNFHIVLVSRCGLPLEFSDLYITGSLVQITAEQLRFAAEEIALLCTKWRRPVTPEQAEDIGRYTGGWAIGLNALLLSGGAPTERALALLDDFILTNIWERWDEATRDFMLKTSIAGELTPPLCNALADIQDSEKTLERLAAQNAFISCEKKGVYLYHNLFQTFLLRMAEERSEDFVRAQWEKAGNWYLSQNDFYSAVDFFIKSENHEGVAKSFELLIATGKEYYSIEKLISVAHHASMIEKAAEKSPSIYSTLSWAAFNEGRATDMGRYADLYYRNQNKIVQIDPRLQFFVGLVRLVDFRHTMHDMLRESSETPEIPASKLGVSVGTINQNLPLLHRGTRDFSECALGDIEANIERLKASLGHMFGDSTVLLAECVTAGLLYEQGQLEKAYSHALVGNVEIKKHTAPESKFFAMSVLVYIFDAMNQPKEAQKVVTRIESMIKQERAYYLSRNFRALVYRRKLEKNDIQAAHEWISKHETTPDEDLSFHAIYETLTTIRAYIVSGHYDSAIILLKKVRRLAQAYKRFLGVIETDVLLSIAYWKKKRHFQEEAMKHLEEAVTSAHGFGYMQIFINNGSELAELLKRMQKSFEQRSEKDSELTGFIKMLYLNAEERQSGKVPGRTSKSSVKFTDKQKYVMKLICEGKSYREITEMLGIKLSTLRSHISLIYNKLDVTKQTEAIQKIKSLHFLDEM